VKENSLFFHPFAPPYKNGNSLKGYWIVAGSGILIFMITNKRLTAAGYFEILNYYESLHLCD